MLSTSYRDYRRYKMADQLDWNRGAYKFKITTKFKILIVSRFIHLTEATNFTVFKQLH